MIKFNIKLFFLLPFFLLISLRPLQSAEMVDPIKVDWSFKGLTGTFDRASLQRGFQVYKKSVLLVIQCNILAIEI